VPIIGMTFFEFASSIRPSMGTSIANRLFQGQSRHQVASAPVMDDGFPATNESVISRLDALEAELLQVRESIDKGSEEIKQLRTGYQDLCTSLAVLFGEISRE
jgi:hypothetical protein